MGLRCSYVTDFNAPNPSETKTAVHRDNLTKGRVPFLYTNEYTRKKMSYSHLLPTPIDSLVEFQSWFADLERNWSHMICFAQQRKRLPKELCERIFLQVI